MFGFNKKKDDLLLVEDIIEEEAIDTFIEFKELFLKELDKQGPTVTQIQLRSIIDNLK